MRGHGFLQWVILISLKKQGLWNLKMNEWISVEERLPPKAGYDKCKRYLIFMGYHEFAYYFNGKWVSNPDDFYSEYEPTHWALLIPPKEKK